MNFIPYGKQNIDQNDINEVINTLKSDFLTTGPKIKEFENNIASFCNAKYCVSVSNGTAALHLSSLVLLNKNDKVLTTPNSFLATSNSILYAEAIPIFVDIYKNGNIDLDLCEEYLKKDSSIKALYCVSFSGNMVNQEKLFYLKKTYNIKILEDNAHAIGAKYNNIKAGSCKNSDLSIFSFHPIKHITTGEGGAITTNEKLLYDKLIALRNHGMYKTPNMKAWQYEMKALGFNYRLDDISCSLGISQLKKLPTFINKRKLIAKKYNKEFLNTSIKPLYKYSNNSSYHLYVILIDFSKQNISKEQLFLKLKEKNIGIQVHYIAINKQAYYKNLGYGKEYTPIMDNYYKQCISIPIYASLKEDEQDYVIKTLKELII